MTPVLPATWQEAFDAVLTDPAYFELEEWTSVTVITCRDADTADKVATKLCDLITQRHCWPAVPPDSVRNRGSVVKLVWRTAQVCNPSYAIRSATLTPGAIKSSTHEINGLQPPVKVTYWS
jgi:hypothetical protein